MVVCKQCGSPTSPNELGGLCPRCLLQETLASIATEEHHTSGSTGVLAGCPTLQELNKEFSGLTFVELLGKGGSGWTYLAIQESLSRQVAVKLLSRPTAETENWSTRFRREAEHLAKLNHPLIVTIHDFGTTERFAYIIMEYVDGPTLREQLQFTKLLESQVLEIIQQILLAAEYAHGQGLVHRDIKPENILVQSFGSDITIKVADFGISKIVSSEIQHTNLTAAGHVIGTPFYMAPEQYLPQSKIDHRVDIYSIGVLMYEMLTGRLPVGHFEAPSVLGQCGKHWDRIVFKSLSYDPNNRYESASELLEDLRRTPNAVSRNKIIYWVAGLLVVAGLILAGLYSSSDDELAPIESNPFQPVEAESPFQFMKSTQQDTGDR